MSAPLSGTAASAVQVAVAVAADFGLRCAAPVLLADGANIVVHLSPSAVVAKVAASTLRVRAPAQWLARELAVAGYLEARGIPVVEPSDELPGGVHERNGRPMTFWRYEAHDAGAVPDPATAGALLRTLHGALEDCPVELPRLGTPLQDIAGYLARPGPHDDDLSLLRDVYARLASAVVGPAGSEQPLHGDPHPGNLLTTDRGWTWCDLEDACSGPVAWDLAALAGSTRLDGAAAVRAYGVDPATLEVWHELRRLHATVWYLLYAERLPRHRARARELLAGWRTV